MRILNHRFLIIIIIIVLLIGLNLRKFQDQRDEIIPVWSSYDENYYEENEQSRGFFEKLSPGQLLYKLTRVRIRAPITYLKREIPLLGYYVPEDLKEPTETIYQPADEKDKLIQLKFDLNKLESDQAREEAKQELDIDYEQRDENSQVYPRVFIYHTHTSETYFGDPRTQDNNGHVMPGEIGAIGQVGAELAAVLSKKYRFRVVHTTEVHDENYARSYFNSRQTVKEFIDKNPEVDLILDLHRDGIKKVTDNTISTMVNGQKVARIMIVVTNGSYNFAHLNLEGHHTRWQDNLNFARKLGAKMDELYPGLLNRIEIRDTTYNQDLHPQSLLLEMGDYQNTTQEVIRSTHLLADVFAALMRE